MPTPAASRAIPDEALTLPPPVHVAIIMDGNGRWARARGLPRTAGHKAGVSAVKRTVKAASALGIDYLTLFGFSAENWRRPAAEVSALMGLLRLYLRTELAELHAQGVQMRFIGDRDRLPRDIRSLMREAETLTNNNQGLFLTIALSYGARQEIAAACRRIAVRVAAGTLDPADISAEMLDGEMETWALPDPDLLIRTSGEQRISNFLLWQAAYAELVFLDGHWPDFGRAQLEQAISEYHRRERRFGAVSA